MQDFSCFSMHVGYHSVFFTHLTGMKSLVLSIMHLKDIRALGMTGLELWDLIMKKPKKTHAQGKLTNSWNDYGVSIVLDDWRNVKGKSLICVLGVFGSGASFPSAHDYS